MPQKRYRSTFYWQSKQYECASSKSQKDADQKAALKLQALERGEIGISSGMTVRRWAKEWLEVYKRPAVGDKAFYDYQHRIDNKILPVIGNMRLSDVTDVHLQGIVNSNVSSYSHAKKVYDTIKAMFRQAHASRLATHNPAEYLTMPKTTAGTHRNITDFERAHFLRAASTHHAGLMFKVVLCCGLRPGEVSALSWNDIDWEKQRIKVRFAVEGGTNRIKGTKTAAGVREVPMPDEIYTELKAGRGEPFEPIFLQPKGKCRHTESSRAKAWASLKNEMDISMGAVFNKRKAKDGKMRMTKVLSVVAPDFTPYCLRHTYCTDLQRKGVPINVAKYLMGHSSITVTAKIYTHMTDDVIDLAAIKINGNDNGIKGDNAKKSG